MSALRQQHTEELARLAHEHEARLQDIDEWCRGEIEAVQHNARQQVAQAHQAVQEWQAKYDDAAAQLQDLGGVTSQLRHEVEQARRALHASEQELGAAGEALVRSHRQCAEAAAASEEEARQAERRYAEQLELKRAQHAEQLAHIEGRLQGVVAKKDATIAALRAELQKTYETLLPLRSI